MSEQEENTGTMNDQALPELQQDAISTLERPVQDTASPPGSPFWLWVAFGYGCFYHTLQFLFVISPYERPILLGEQPVTPPAEGQGQSFAEMLVSNGFTVPEWFLNGVAVTAALSVIFLVAGLFRRKWGLYGYILATFVLIGLTIAAGIFSPIWLLFPMLITVVGVMNRDRLI